VTTGIFAATRDFMSIEKVQSASVNSGTLPLSLEYHWTGHSHWRGLAFLAKLKTPLRLNDWAQLNRQGERDHLASRQCVSKFGAAAWEWSGYW